ncbi:MAG: preprotein translocase subunit SecE [Oligoflexia bacterium]|nr:preprotein translocase subunit SecE [Oligoflexia bacterium]
MDNTKKILSLVFLVCAALVWFLSTRLLFYVSGYFQLMEGYSWSLLVNRIVPVILGIITYVVLYRITKIKEYAVEVINEVKKVVWPGKKETWGATVVVIIAVIVSGIVLGIFDWVSSSLLRLILK